LGALAIATRPSAHPQAPVGHLRESEAPHDTALRVGKVFERIVPAPTTFLRWLIANADQMECANDMTFGSRDLKVQEWRRKLLRGSAEERTEGPKADAAPGARTNHVESLTVYGASTNHHSGPRRTIDAGLTLKFIGAARLRAG
jgi:hypothetical protein